MSTVERLAEYVRDVVDQAPPLTPEQRSKIGNALNRGQREAASGCELIGAGDEPLARGAPKSGTGPSTQDVRVTGTTKMDESALEREVLTWAASRDRGAGTRMRVTESRRARLAVSRQLVTAWRDWNWGEHSSGPISPILARLGWDPAPLTAAELSEAYERFARTYLLVAARAVAVDAAAPRAHDSRSDDVIDDAKESVSAEPHPLRRTWTERPLLSVGQVAELLGTSRKSIYRLIEDWAFGDPSELPYSGSVKRRLKIPRARLQAYVDGDRQYPPGGARAAKIGV